MSKKKNEALSPTQLKNWVRAALSGISPTEVDPDTNMVNVLSLPLARSDGNGLTFTLSKAGTASWVLRYRHANRPRELTLGNYPDLGLSEARKRAREHRSEIDRGADPAYDKKKSKILLLQDWTVNQLIEDYRSKTLCDLSQSTQASYSRALLKVGTRLGSTLVSKVEALDIVNLIEDLDATWLASNMLLIATKMLFRHAVGKKLIVSNPCIGIELSAIMGKRPPKKVRLMLKAEEIKLLMNASMNSENLLAIKILLATAVRSDELRNAKWEHLDFKENVWSVPSSKTGPGIQIPLTQPVVNWFLELKNISKNSSFVLPARKERRKIRLGGDTSINPNTIGAAIEFWLETHKPNIRRFTPHDLRSTAKSHMRSLGISRDITEMCLNHKLKGIEGIYDVHTYFKERKEALTKWADFLLRIENGKEKERGRFEPITFNLNN